MLNFKFPKLYSTIKAAEMVGCSLRHFNRIAKDSGNPGIDFKHHFKYTDEMIQRIVAYHNRKKNPGCPKGLVRLPRVKVLSGS